MKFMETWEMKEAETINPNPTTHSLPLLAFLAYFLPDS